MDSAAGEEAHVAARARARAKAGCGRTVPARGGATASSAPRRGDVKHEVSSGKTDRPQAQKRMHERKGACMRRSGLRGARTAALGSFCVRLAPIVRLPLHSIIRISESQ